MSGDVHHHSANKDPPQPSLFREGDDGPDFTEKRKQGKPASALTLTLNIMVLSRLSGEKLGKLIQNQTKCERTMRTMYSTFKYLLLWLFLACAFFRVLDLANEEVNFKRRLGLAGLKVGHYNVGEYFSEMPHLCLLLGLIGLFVQI